MKVEKYLQSEGVVIERRITNRVNKNELDSQLILSIFRHPLHVSGVSRPIIRRYNRTELQSNQDNRQSCKKSDKYQFYTCDCIS